MLMREEEMTLKVKSDVNNLQQPQNTLYLSRFALAELDDLGGLDLTLHLEMNVCRRFGHDH